MPMVSFILHSVSVTGTICIHRLNGNGEVVVANLIHLHGSFSTILNAILPTGAASITILSESKLFKRQKELSGQNLSEWPFRHIIYFIE